jgi:ferredoxin-NADP reductase/MOSC domain-containing protein YiiM
VPTLVSVNVGLPKDVPWNGRVVHTGAWKEPVAGRRMVRRLNIDGDGQGDLGGHGGENRAVLVYQLDSYRHWASELNRDDLTPGLFGENLTVDGLPDDEVCVGDRYRIGDAVLEVTQPRVTCYRAGMRLGEPRMAALLVAHHRPGFYCRVINEGEVEAGQDIVKIGSGPEQFTVAAIDALLYLPGHTRADLARALRIPALSPGWQGSFRGMLDETAVPPAWPGFRPLRVSAVRQESALIRSITFTSDDGPLPAWLPGQSIALRLGPGVVRNYSLSNDPAAGEFRISVKLEEHGAGSGFVHRELNVGGTVDVAAPRGTFTLADDDRPVLLVSAGVGITPVLSMLHTLVDAASERDVWWLHGARNSAERAFTVEVAQLLDRLPNSHSRVLYSRPDDGDRDFDGPGRLTVADVQDIGVPTDAEAYLCGPAAFMSELTAGLVDYGLDPARVHSETFGAAAGFTPGIASTTVAPHLPAGPPGTGPEVQFARSAVAAPYGSQANLLEFAEACDVPVRWSCRTGVCHNCETALLAGAVEYDPEPLEPPADGSVLICCARPTEGVVLDL